MRSPSASFPVDPGLAPHLADARRQVHHAAQFLTAMGISYLPHEADDSHTNMGWVSLLGALSSHRVPAPKPFYAALSVADLTVHIVDESNVSQSALSLNGRTIASAADWLRARVADRGLDPSRFTLDKHYTIPSHVVDDGASFNASNTAAFEQLARWFGGAADVLESVRAANNGSDVRCWPHHFDIATLLDLGGGKTIGIGMEPGDVYYDEPYFYVNAHPQPSAPPTITLAGGGQWHTREWIGAALPGSRVERGNAQQQGVQVMAFVASAITALKS